MVILLPKVHGGPGLQAFRPISLPTTDYRVLSGVLMARLRRHLPDLTYAVPGRSSSWNIARVSDETAGASRHDTPLAVISLDLKSAFGTLSRSYLFALLEKLGLPSTFLGWIAILYGEADASIRVGDVYIKAFPLLNGRTLGRGNVVAYADDIVLFIRDDAQFELVPLIFEEFRMSSGVAVSFKKSCGLWCGSWKLRTDSPLGISWTSESLTALGCTITTRNTVASQASHLMGLLERAIARWSPFTRGLSLVGRARAANSLVLGSILHHLHGYLPPETTIGWLQARLARFVWGTSRVSWLPGRILARPDSDGGVGLLDIAGQFRLACLKGVQASHRGAANGYSWLVRSRAWLTPPAPDVWHSPRRRRLLSLWEAASSVLELDHRVLHPASLRSLRLRGDNRFLRPPDLLAPERWLKATVDDFSDGAPELARSTRAALLDAQHLGAFCQRLLRENASSSYHAEYEAETIVLRGSATPITRLPSQRARRALDSARLQAHPTAELAARWTLTVDVPRSIPWADLRRNCFSGHDADVALRLALYALSHPDHPASRRANCAACGSSDGSLTHRYWNCRAVRPLLQVFASCDLPLDLQAWLFCLGLHPEAINITSVAKATIHMYHLGLEVGHIAGVLKQVHPDGNIYPVQYYSRALRSYERNYTISELECLTIVECVDKFRVYLLGTRFVIYSDHHALQWLKTTKDPTGRLFRWSLRLSAYDYEVKYLKGSRQYEADLLSRNPFCGFLSTGQIKDHQGELRRDTRYILNDKDLMTITRRGVTKIIVPPSLRGTLLQRAHRDFNHPCISQMTRLIAAQYYWDGMTNDIRTHVITCSVCQLVKPPKGPIYGELGQLPPAVLPYELVSLDTISGFAKYGNSQNLHVVVDHATRYAWAFPSRSTSILTYTQVIKKVMQFGSPKRLLTDRTPAFTSPKFRRFFIRHNIGQLLTTSNNPQSNGLSERLNATITGKLELLRLQQPKTAWTKLLPQVLQAYNHTPHSVTGFPRSYLLLGSFPLQLSEHVQNYPKIDDARELAYQRTHERHLRDKARFDQTHRVSDFEERDLVLAKTYHHPDTGKLAPFFSGPYEILEIISPQIVRINRSNRPLSRETDTIHVNKLKHYTENEQFISPPVNDRDQPKNTFNFPYKHFNHTLIHTETAINSRKQHDYTYNQDDQRYLNRLSPEIFTNY
ncbi:hypothetical protein LAZ67_13001403 [Cordylochernes scorpioides]|uniref:RNA-directed DNA polymerase n=1 Tax=Cordylochernes scorpioides TaxID=51811 RepID=A0ABY6L3T2_9ARAC|nr:hypothetical protein LAZ67_13001403 [Cordylochernes scorpioides]